MANLLRRMMSKNRRRYTENGFDLDLCYVTDRIIAMGYPAEGGLFRNPRSEIVRLLQSRHEGHYRVYNLCQEKPYDPQSLGGEVVWFPFGDHQTPSLGMIVDFCQNAEQWLLADPRNTVVVHCKAGKGRTGIMICALLMHMGRCDFPEEALRLFADRRTTDGVGVTIPSQRRYVFYFYNLLRGGGTVPSPVALTLERIRLSGLPKHMLPRLMVCLWIRDNNTSEHKLLVRIRSIAATKHNAQSVRCASPSSGRSFLGHLPDGEKFHLLISSQELYIVFEHDVGTGNEWRIGGDLKIQVFEETLPKRSSLFFTWVNTNYIEQPHVVFRRHEMDKVNRCLSSQVQMEVFFSGVLPRPRPWRGTSFVNPSSRRHHRPPSDVIPVPARAGIHGFDILEKTPGLLADAESRHSPLLAPDNNRSIVEAVELDLGSFLVALLTQRPKKDHTWRPQFKQISRSMSLTRRALHGHALYLAE